MTTIHKRKPLATLLLEIISSITLFAEESVKNAHKYNGTGNVVSNADLANYANGNVSSAVNIQANASRLYKMYQINFNPKMLKKACLSKLAF